MKYMQKSTYRQTGWKNKASGDIQVCYGSEVPSNQDDFEKMWDNVTSEEILKQSYEEWLAEQQSVVPSTT